MKTKFILLWAVLIFAFTVTSCKNDTVKSEIIKTTPLFDTLKGEWNWVMTMAGSHGDIANDFTSIIKILSQNEDASINYEIFVEDTLFYKGSFQIQNDWGYCKMTNIILPNGGRFNFGPNDGYWCMSISPFTKEETLVFGDNYFEGYYYYYERIK